jgi:hypothetical protein
MFWNTFCWELDEAPISSALCPERTGSVTIPAYLGPRGYGGVYLDGPEVDWGEVSELVRDSLSFVRAPSASGGSSIKQAMTVFRRSPI